ncbi:hypothetical protein [Acinetobacter sp. 'aerobic (ED)']|uniref:hypothetical protein n=1 Tax=Acinetobacter sp. 'aerobic (ED)' TaxID=174230 RepID=UPI00192B9B62|nr:hypothetical protein [Acinetobacter sp. 'aerobic (ED)']
MNESISPNMYIKPDYGMQVEQWLAKGNQIKTLSNGVSTHNKTFNNRPKKVVSESQCDGQAARRLKEQENKASTGDVRALGKWVKARIGRSKELSKLLGHANGYISQIQTFTKSCSKEKMVLIKEKMKEIEARENVTKHDGEGR